VRGDDLAVKLRGRVEIMVVGRESRRGERVGLPLGEHAQRATGLHAECANAAHHFEHPLEMRPVGNVSPGGAHTEAARPLLFRARSRRDGLFHAQQFPARDTGAIVRRLRAVGAVFRTAAGLDAEQHATLHFVRAMVHAVCDLCPEDEIRQRGRCRSTRSLPRSSRGVGYVQRQCALVWISFVWNRIAASSDIYHAGGPCPGTPARSGLPRAATRSAKAGLP